MVLAVASGLLVPLFFMDRLFGIRKGPAEVIGAGPLVLLWLASCAWQVFVIARQTRSRRRSLALAAGCVVVCVVAIELAAAAALVVTAGGAHCSTAGVCVR